MRIWKEFKNRQSRPDEAALKALIPIVTELKMATEAILEPHVKQEIKTLVGQFDVRLQTILNKYLN